MPSQGADKTLLRFMALIRLLNAQRPGQTSQELTDKLNEAGYSIGKRTVERDLNTLAEVFPDAIQINEGMPRGWMKFNDHRLDLIGLSLTDALTLNLAEQAITPILTRNSLKVLMPRFEQARAVIATLASSNEQAAWAGKVRNVSPNLPMKAPHVDERVLEQVQDCLLKGFQIDVTYLRAGAAEPKQMPLNPLALVQRGPVSYLIATARDYDKPVPFALHRIQSASCSYRPLAKREKPFDLDAFINSGKMQFGGDEATCDEIHLELRVTDWLKQILSETPLTDDQQLVEDGEKWRVTASVRDTRQLLWWILSQGAGVEVIAPAGLRVRVGQALRDAASAYV